MVLPRWSFVAKLCSASPLSIFLAGILASFPFAYYVGSRLELRAESLAVCFSGCEILLLFSGPHAG